MNLNGKFSLKLNVIDRTVISTSNNHWRTSFLHFLRNPLRSVCPERWESHTFLCMLHSPLIQSRAGTDDHCAKHSNPDSLKDCSKKSAFPGLIQWVSFCIPALLYPHPIRRSTFSQLNWPRRNALPHFGHYLKEHEKSIITLKVLQNFYSNPTIHVTSEHICLYAHIFPVFSYPWNSDGKISKNFSMKRIDMKKSPIFFPLANWRKYFELVHRKEMVSPCN